MAYVKHFTIDAGPAGDTVKDVIVTKVDGNIDAIFADLNTHEALTTGAHGVGSGTIVGTALTQTLTNKTLSGTTLTGTITGTGATYAGGTFSGTFTGGTLSGTTLSGVTTAAGIVNSGTITGGTLSGTTLSGTITASGVNWVGLAGGATKDITQASHGFVVGDVLKFAGGVYAKAQADSAANAEVVGMVSVVGAGTDDFTLLNLGYVSGLSGLTANTEYFLSPTTAGAITATEPSTIGQVSKPLLLATSTTAGYFNNYRGMVIVSNTTDASFSGTATIGNVVATNLSVTGTVTATGAAFVGANDMPGHTIQTVRTLSSALATSTTAIPWDDSIPQKNEGALFSTCAITPTATNNLIVVQGVAHMGAAAGSVVNTMCIFSGTASNAVATANVYSGAHPTVGNAVAYFVEAATSTATITYTARYGTHDGTAVNLNGYNTAVTYNTMNSGLIVSEVAV